MDKTILETAQHCTYSGNCYECEFGSMPKTCAVVFAKAIADHDEKYGWHDLIENPNDLPPIDMLECLVRQLWEDGDVTYDVVYVKHVLDYADAGVIVAWKEIEP